MPADTLAEVSMVKQKYIAVYLFLLVPIWDIKVQMLICLYAKHISIISTYQAYQ